jgi:uncharacterized protein YjbJ (UPF0337 family)
MGTRNKASNKLQDLKGRGEEAVGKATDDKDLESKGQSNQAKSALKDVGEKVKDAVSKVKDRAQS